VAAPIVVNSRLVEQHLVAREALQRSEEFLRTATEAGELGLWAWDLQSDRIVCSRRLYELHGLPPDAPGNRSADFISLVHPEDLPHVNARREAALSGAGDYVVEFRPIRPDGRTCWLSARAQVFRDAAGQPVRMIGATIDVTHRIELLARERSARAEAESARQRLELLATASASLSASLSPETTVKAITEVVVPQLADWCLVDLAGACGQAARMTLHHEDPERARAGSVALQRLFASTPEVGSLAWCLIHGRPVRRNEWSATEPTSDSDAAMQSFARAIGLRSCCVVPLTARGRQIGVLAIFQTESAREITPADGALLEALAQRAAVALDNARLYTEAEDARRQAEDARRSAEDANKAKDAFLAMLGHELRNPLAPIVTNLKLMALRDDASSRAERIVIERQVGHLARLVDDLLDVARIAHGDVRLGRQRVLVKDILQRAIETVTPLLESRRHRLELDLRSHAAQAGELAVDADEHRLVQVFSNLLTNAARYTPDGGHIVLRTDSRDDACHIVVQDNGRGIEKDLLPRVFELFFQSEQGLDRADGGLGIGLAIVKNLVALHGGEVAAYSEGPGCGSSFVVRLPLASSPSPIEAIAAAVPAIPPATARKRILLVDDNLDALESMCILLELRGHDVRTAVDPIAALTLAASFSPDIAILDIGLPGMDGYDLAGRLRAGGSACRLLALTGYGLAEDRARSLAAGFELHLVKPVDPAALLDALE
jgi:PAS domain S-box-containing protein